MLVRFNLDKESATTVLWWGSGKGKERQECLGRQQCGGELGDFKY